MKNKLFLVLLITFGSFQNIYVAWSRPDKLLQWYWVNYVSSPDKFLLKSAKSCSLEGVQLALKAGANVNAINFFSGTTALIMAAECADVEIVKYLVQNGACLNIVDNFGVNALGVAAQYGRMQTVQYLVQAGANMNTADVNGVTVLMFVATNRTPSTFQTIDYLIQHGENVHAVNNNGENALMYATSHGNATIMEYLVHSGVNVNSVNNSGETILHYAIWSGTIDIVEYVINVLGINVNVADIAGKTALMQAVDLGQPEIVDYLVRYGANVHAVNNNGMTALGYALQNGYGDSARLLLKAGAKLVLTKFDKNIIQTFFPENIAKFDALITQWNNYNKRRVEAISKLPRDIRKYEIMSRLFVPTVTEQIQTLATTHLQKIGRGKLIRVKVAKGVAAH